MAARELPFGWERPYRYGQALAHLELGEPGAEELFNTALTHGLLALAAATIQGHAAGRRGRQPAAIFLLADLTREFGETDGVCMVPTREVDNPEFQKMFGLEPPASHVSVQTSVLREALELADAARHGRGAAGLLTEEHRSALEDLDNHPALRTLSAARNDREWTLGVRGDAYEFGRAHDYLQMLGEDEINRRLDAVREAPYAPSYDDAEQIQDCPVCGLESLLPTGGDDMGYGITAGTCYVCSYARSPQVAYDLQMDLEIQRLSSRD